MSDLDNLMKKLKKTKPKEEEVEDPEEEMSEKEEVVEDDDEEPEEDPEEDDVEEELEVPKPELKKVSKAKEPSQEEIIGNEIGILQNNGIYRREKLSLMREQTDVLKIIAQVFLDAKKSFMTSEKDGKGKK